MESSAKEVKVDIPGLIRVFKDGSVERFLTPPYVPPSPEDPNTGVSSKDITISALTPLSARLYLPKAQAQVQAQAQAQAHAQTQQLLPILVYFHSGTFCVDSAFSLSHHRYISTLSSQAQVLVISVDYRKAPEHPLPTAYHDAWAALQWVASHRQNPNGPPNDKWLAGHGDLDCVFVGGECAGANIAHHLALRAGSEGLAHGMKLRGAFLSCPFFLDGDKKSDPGLELMYKVWEFVYPDGLGGSDSPMINPMGVGAPRLSGLGCGRMLVVVAEKDVLRESGVRYCDAVIESGFAGTVELFEVEEEGHVFHLSNPESHNSQLLLLRLAVFLQK